MFVFAVDSKDAGDQGVMAAAAAASFPATSAGDWSTVNLLNVNAQTSLSVSELATFFPDGIDQTWPIVAASYVFVQRDLTSMGETGAAVKAFLVPTPGNIYAIHPNPSFCPCIRNYI